MGYGGSQILRLAGSLILARLLLRKLFELMGIANVFMIGLQLFSDVGIRFNKLLGIQPILVQLL